MFDREKAINEKKNPQNHCEKENNQIDNLKLCVESTFEKCHDEMRIRFQPHL